MRKLTVVTTLGVAAWLGRKQLGELAMNIEVSIRAWQIVRRKLRARVKATRVMTEQDRIRLTRMKAYTERSQTTRSRP